MTLSGLETEPTPVSFTPAAGHDRLLASRYVEEPSEQDYSQCVSRLERLIGPLPSSQHGSLEATIVNEWGTGGDLLSMAFMALGASSGEFDDYAEVEKVLL